MAEISGQDSLKSIRKLRRKVRKCQGVVEKETGTECCDSVAKHIAICNAGLSNGLTEETVLEEFMKHGPLENITMLAGKSCCFVTYKTTKNAQNAFNAINGKVNIAQDCKPIYLSYCKTVPPSNLINFNEKPNGLVVIEDFVGEIEEKRLLHLIGFDDGRDSKMKHRHVKHFGYEFRYDINNVDKDCKLEQGVPEDCLELLKKVDFVPDQLTINRYNPGQGIPPHVDTHSAFEDPIMSLSLGSDIVMDFRHSDGRHHQILLPKRSLAIISKESRYDWTHGITPRKLDVIPTDQGITVSKRGVRTSFTFRKVLHGECNCNFKDRCDSSNKIRIGEYLAVKLENIHVHRVYEKIADHFSDTRHKPWPNVLDFVKSFETGSILLDVGCGNGKYLGNNSQIFDIGCDMSCGLTNVCKQRGFQVFNCNCLNVPLRDGVANGIISIAVIHHLASEERRKTAIKEMVRILQPDGRALIYVWAKDQTKEDKSSYLKQDRKNRKQESSVATEESKTVTVADEVALPVHTNRKQFQHQDLLVPWKLKKENVVEDEFLRFYHVFEEGELESLCKEIDGVDVVKSYYDQGNWCVVLRKIK